MSIICFNWRIFRQTVIYDKHWQKAAGQSSFTLQGNGFTVSEKHVAKTSSSESDCNGQLVCKM